MDFDSTDSFYNLLPEIYRIRDWEQGNQLKALLSVISKQAKIIRDDITRLYNNFFIETCDDWVIPYIGDIIGNNPLHITGRANRADVAKTIYYRRHKGTLPMLEEMVHDVTQWGCHAVEFFELIESTQNLNHLRLQNKECAEVRDLTTMDLVNSAFNTTSHTIDVRAINQFDGRYNIKNIGFYLWRLEVFPLRAIKPQLVDQAETGKPHCYHFGNLGQPYPLYSQPNYKSGIRTPEQNLPAPIRPLELAFNKDFYYGENGDISIYLDEDMVEKDKIVFKDLCSWPEVPDEKVAIDTRLGRFAFGQNFDPGKKEIRVNYNTAFSAYIGAGTYERSPSLYLKDEKLDPDHDLPCFIRVTEKGNSGNGGEDIIVNSISNAISEWEKSTLPDAIIQIEDSHTYGGNIDITLPTPDSKLVIQAANHQRPTLALDEHFNIKGSSSNDYGTIILNGLLITGTSVIQVGSGLVKLEINHCTIDPGGGLASDGKSLRGAQTSLEYSSEYNPNPQFQLIINSSIVGQINFVNNIKKLVIKDSIVDSCGGTAIGYQPPEIITEGELSAVGPYGPPSEIERSTILGKCKFQELILASDTLFLNEVEVQRKQDGCVRFSYIPKGSKMPRQYKCIFEELPEDSSELSSPKPSFTSLLFGDPRYCQLSVNCNELICSGAENGSELGAFSSWNNPLKLLNLKKKLEEYLPIGLKPGLIFKT